MRFSPYKDTPYDDLSMDDSQFVSSPLKSMLETPLKVKTVSNNKIINNEDSPYSSRKYTSVFETTPLKNNLKVNEKQEVDLSDLLADLDIKERLGLISTGSNKRNSVNFIIKVNDVNDSLYQDDDEDEEDEEESGDSDSDFLKQLESSVLNAFESRIDERSKRTQETVDYVKRERERLIQEKKERERKEAEAKRIALEEEKRKQEAEKERLRKEAEKQEKLKKEAEQKAKEEEAKKQVELEAKKKQEEEVKKQEELRSIEESKKKTKGVTNFDTISHKFHQYKAKIQNIKETIIKPISENVDLKKMISQHKRKINPKFGQLTNSMAQLSKITNDLIALINLTKPEPLAYQWILNFVCKAIVSQAETEVRAKPSSSLALAKLTLNLLCEFPEMKDFLLARFIKKCPYIIGHCIHLTNDDATFVEMGWRRHDGKSWETQVTYDERMSGMITLFFVITRLPLDQRYYSTHKHPLPLSNAWIFIARMLNTPKERLTSTHFTIVTAWWEACAKEILSNYGIQGQKVLRAASKDWCQLVADKKSDFPGANMLQTKGEDWENERTVKSFPEMEP